MHTQVKLRRVQYTILNDNLSGRAEESTATTPSTPYHDRAGNISRNIPL